MYASYFGLREKPFTVTPNSRFFYSNPVYQEAYATLLYGIRERKGFVVLTGEAGTGKTTLLHRLMHNLEGSVPFVFFYNTFLSFDELLSFACDELRIKVQGKGRLARIRSLNDFLIEQLRRGRTTALLIDEAQNLTENALENLRLLSNLETESEKLLQIILTGQPELELLFDQPHMRQLKQRIALYYRLRRLEKAEIRSYIEYRLRTAGSAAKDLFTPESIELVVNYSRGIPRLINALCDGALQATSAASAKRVTGDVVRNIAGQLELNSKAAPTLVKAVALSPESGRKHWLAAATVIGALGAGAAAYVRYAAHVETYLSGASHQSGKAASDAPAILVARDSIANARVVDAPPEDNARAELVSEESQAGESEAIDGRPAGILAGSPYSAPVDEPPPAAAKQEPSVAKEAIVEDNKLAQPRPSPLDSVAYHFYGAGSLLGLDLLMETNPQLEAGLPAYYASGLRFPCLSRETLQRQKPDGSYHLILGSFPNQTSAQRFASAVRLEGYRVAITQRNSGNFSFHRVEITGLHNLEAADHAWAITLANRWIASSHC